MAPINPLFVSVLLAALKSFIASPDLLGVTIILGMSLAWLEYDSSTLL